MVKCGYFYKNKSYSKEEIINMIEQEIIPDIQQGYLNYTVYDQDKIKALLGIAEGLSLGDYMLTTYPNLLDKIKQYNSEITFNFSDKDISGFGVNEIHISLSEIYHMANSNNLNYNDVLNYFIEHEAQHAITMPGWVSVEFRDKFTPALNKARELYKKRPFEDKYRGNVLFDGYPYALRNEQEFLSEMNSNPQFKKWLKSIGTTETSLWKTVVNMLRTTIGLNAISNLYEQIDDIVNSDDYRESGLAILANYPQELRDWGIQNANEVWSASLFQFENQSENERFLEALDKLPKIILDLKKYIENPSNDISTREAKGLKNIYDKYIDFQSIQDSGESHIKKTNELVNLITSTYRISERILSDLKEVLNGPASIGEKTTIIMALKLEAKGLSFLNEVLTDVQSVLGDNMQTKKFANLISVIKDTPAKLHAEYKRLIKPNLVDKLAIDPKDSKVFNDLQERIDNLTEKINNEPDINRKLFLQRQLQIAQQDQSRIPTKETLNKVLNNEWKDANWVQLKLHSMASNSDPFLQTLHLVLIRAQNVVLERRLERGNIMQNIIDAYVKATGKKSFRNMDDITKNVQTTTKVVMRIEEDEEGNIKEIIEEPRSIVSTFGPDYIFDYSKLKSYSDYWTVKALKARMEKDPKEDEYWAEKNEATQKLREFKKQHVQREYKEEYYQAKDLLYETHPTFTVRRNDKDVKVSLMNMKGDLYAEQDQYEVNKAISTSDGEVDDANLNLDRINTELKKINRLVNDLGEPKTGIDLWLAEQSRKYYEAKSKTGSYVLTQKGKDKYERDVKNIKKEYDFTVSTINARQMENERLKDSRPDYKRLVKQYENNLNTAKEKYEYELKRIQKSNLPQAFWDERTRIKEELSSDLNLINKIKDPVVTEIFARYQFLLDETLRIKTNDNNFDTINQMISPYRDNDGIVDGILFEQESGVDAVLKIKQIEEEQEQLRKDLKAFRKLENRQKKALRKENQLIDDFLINYQVYNSMFKSSPSEYYEQEFDSQLNKLQIENRKLLTNYTKEELEKYYKDNNIIANEDGTYEKITKNKGVIKHSLIYKDVSDFEINEGNRLARLAIYKSEWYQNNHVLKSTFIEDESGKGGSYQDEMVPIAIWQERTAADKIKFSKVVVPISKYNEFIINDELKNDNVELVYKDLNSPKESSIHYTPNNLKIPQADLDLRNSLKDFYFKSQEDSAIPDNQRLYYILPSVSKNESELKIEFMDSLLNGKIIENIKNWKKDQFGYTDDDNQVLELGSNDRLLDESALRQITFRFNRILDNKEQTKNIFASLLVFDNHNQDVYNRKQNQELFTMASDATSDMVKKDEFEGKLASLFSWKNLRMSISNKGTLPETQLVEKSGVSNLAKSVKYLDDTFIAGQVKDDSRITIAGKTIDGHKLLSRFKEFMSRATFGLKVFSPLKNMISQTIFSYINTSIAWGFATKSDYNWAQMVADKFSINTVNSIKKVGNRSKESQALDYFKVMNGAVYNEYGKLTQWTSLMQVADSLALPKHMAEFRGQVVQFLAISKANMVEVNGNLVPFHEAFFTDDTGKYRPIDGALYNGEPIQEIDIERVRGKITEINRRLNGAMAALDRGEAGKSVFGSASLYLGAFIMPGLRARFGKSYYNLEIDTQIGGYYTQAMNLAGDMIKYGRSIPWETLRPEEKRRVTMFVQEFAMAVSLMVLFYMMGGGADKGELEKNAPMYNYLLALIMGAGSEVQTFIPFPGVGLDELQRKITSPFAVVKQINDSAKVLRSLAYLMVNSDDAYYKNKTQDNFLHDKGDIKFVPEFLKLRFGLDLRELNGLDKLIQTKSGQQLRQ